MVKYLVRLIVFSCFFNVSPVMASTVHELNATSPHSIVATHPLLKEHKKFRFARTINRLTTNYLIHKKTKGSGLAVVFGILSILLLSFIIFGAAYGGASAGALVLIGLLGLGLIIFTIIKIKKARQRKK